jgi:putative endopeptidase
MRTSLRVLSSATLLLAACASSKKPDAPPPPAASASASASAQPPARILRGKATTLEQAGLSAAALDRTVDPCTDFHQFACGGWLKSTEIPADRARWSRFNEISDRNQAELRRILEAAQKGTGDKRLGAFYGACMDTAKVDHDAAQPLEPLLKLTKRAYTAKSLADVLAELHKERIFAFFDISGDQDFGDATKVLANLDQNGLGLPDRDYYTKEDDKSKEIRKAYGEHVKRMFTLAGLRAKEIDTATEDVLRIETALAKASKTKVERRDPQKLYNKMDRAALAKLAPNFPWDAYFKGLGIPDIKEVNLTHPPFFTAVSDLVKAEKAPALQHYLQWQVVRSVADLLAKPFVDESFAMKKTLTGVQEQPPRFRTCVELTDASLGEVLAQEFVKTKFGGDSKTAAERMVKEISVAFGKALQELTFMDPTTKERAKQKLDAMAYLIGFPSKWRTYDFPVKDDTLLANTLAARTAEEKRILARIGKPVDREEWEMTPPTVNAYYHPQKNHMVFPAGILQTPFYANTASIPVNLGGMGMVVGHELTHGFDDEGSQYDLAGNLKSWWEPKTREAFVTKTSCVASQFDAYEPIPGVKLNGKLTLGENIADLGGIKLAFAAYRAMRKDVPVDDRTLADGFTEDQQFFLSVGQSWCAKSRDEETRRLANVDPHSPPKFRVNGPLSNLPAFAGAFRCEAGTPMNPANKCEVW